MRNPYVGEGAEGCRRSAEIDRSEADGLDPGPYRDAVLASAAAWLQQAEDLEAGDRAEAGMGEAAAVALDQAAEVLEGEVVTEYAPCGACGQVHPYDYCADEPGDITDAEVVLSPREQAAQRLVAIAALEQLVRKLKAEHREQAASVYDKPHMKDPVHLNGRELGQARTDAVAGGWKVADAGKWLAYVSKVAPDRVVDVTTESVDPTWQAQLLAALTAGKPAGQPVAWVDLDTGEATDTPPAAAGLQYTPPGHKLVVTAAKDAASQVTHLIGPAARQLGLPELEAD